MLFCRNAGYLCRPALLQGSHVGLPQYRLLVSSCLNADYPCCFASVQATSWWSTLLQVVLNSFFPYCRLLVSFSDPTSPGRTLAVLNPSEPGKLETVPLPYSSFGIFDVREECGRLVLALTGASALKPSEVAVLQVADVDALSTNSAADWTVLRKSTTLEVPLTLWY